MDEAGNGQLMTTIHCESKKLGHLYFYCNFGKCWSIFKILSLSESEINGEHLNANNYCYLLSSVVLFDDVDVTSCTFVYSTY